jgi:hypothetical protein
MVINSSIINKTAMKINSLLYNLLNYKLFVYSIYKSRYISLIALLFFLSLTTSSLHSIAQPILSFDTEPAYEIEARVRNGNSGFEGVLFTPSTPGPGQSGGNPWQMNPAGSPVWNCGGNVYGNIHTFLYTYSSSTGTSTWKIDFNRDGDYNDYKETVSSTTPTLVGNGFKYVNIWGQGSTTGKSATLNNVIINGTNVGSFISNTDIPFSSLYRNASGLFDDVTVSGSFSFSGNAGQENPRIWVRLGGLNQNPTCVITNPTNNSIFYFTDLVTINVDAIDPNGTLNLVELYNGNTKIGEDNLAPYQFNFSNFPSGVVTLKAKATDNLFASTLSLPISITIKCYKEDFNQDGKVDNYDFLILLSKYGVICSSCSEDLNLNGIVDNFDFLILFGKFGSTCY